MLQENYNPAAIERAAQAHWESADLYRAIEHAKGAHGSEKPKYYACSMLPYPSGRLHMGHVRNYTINDMMARQLRMRGYNVLMPMGWDAFGLPAENAAIKKGVPPARWTYENIATMKKQMQAMGLGLDWSREIAACDPNYYKWNQWLFLKMLEAGIAYRKTQIVNWDPEDKTVLANEQVIDGRGWRTGALVEKREIPGYYLKITDYAEELLKHVTEDLKGWPERVRLMQEHWIGKSEGVRFAFTHEIRDHQGASVQDGKLWVFTTRADTIMGVTFCAVAPEHPLATHAAQTNPKIAAFIESAKQGGTSEAELALKEKEGVPTGLFVTHPLTGEPIELWVGNYVLMSYGDGAVMGVPAHDERDFAFAQKYGLPIKQVIELDPSKPSSQGQARAAFTTGRWQEWYGDKSAGRCIKSGVLDGLAYQEAVNKVAQLLAAKGLGEKKITYRLRDWGISRQRYWGTPIPIIHCPDCGPVPVPYKDLPVVLPEDLVPDGTGNPLEKDARFLACQCPECGKPARRETDTMDTFVDSAWYFLRYCSPDSHQSMVDERAAYWMPMDQYIGGIEHAVLHLLYARFWTKVMRDMGLVKFDEPFTRLLCQGMVLNEAFVRRNEKGGKEYFWEQDLNVVRDEHRNVISATAKNDGLPVECEGWTTMSKSKNNGVDPQQLIERYGADTARLFVMFASPPEQTLEWNDAGVEGAHRFLRRVWQFAVRNAAVLKACAHKRENFREAALSAPARALRREIHLALRQAENDYARLQYNTVVSACMKMLNALEDAKLTGDADAAVLAEGFCILLRVLYPATPHITHVLWDELGFAQQFGRIIDAPWPRVDEAALVQDEIDIVVQVNGKLRGSIRVPARAERATIEAAALADERIRKFITGTPKKVVVVPGKLVNVVV